MFDIALSSVFFMLDTMYMVIHFWCFFILYFACRSILVSIDVAVFLFEIASPIRNSEFGFFSLPLLYGAKINELILVGEWWRLVTPMFLVQDWQWGSCSHSVTISALHLANSVKSVRYNSLRIDILVVVGLEASLFEIHVTFICFICLNRIILSIKAGNL